MTSSWTSTVITVDSSMLMFKNLARHKLRQQKIKVSNRSPQYMPRTPLTSGLSTLRSINEEMFPWCFHHLHFSCNATSVSICLLSPPELEQILANSLVYFTKTAAIVWYKDLKNTILVSQFHIVVHFIGDTKEKSSMLRNLSSSRR